MARSVLAFLDDLGYALIALLALLIIVPIAYIVRLAQWLLKR